MIASHANFEQYNPMRPVDWRWQRARWLLENGHNFCRQRDDELIGQAVMFLRSLEPHATPRRVRRLRREISDVVQAYEFHLQEGILPSIVQARILAGQSSSEIGRRVSLSGAVVGCYEKLFYDVRDRLQARAYIQLQAVGLPVSSESRQQRVGKALKALAYYGGPLILELAEAVLFRETGRSSDTRNSPIEFDECLVEKMRLFVELLALPHDMQFLKILRLTNDLLKTTRLDGLTIKSPFMAGLEHFVTASMETLHQNSNNDDVNSVAETQINLDVEVVAIGNCEAA